MANHEAFQQILDVHNLFVQLRYEYWLHYEGYTEMWWLLLCVWILPWIIWFFAVDRRKIVEITLYGVQIMFFASLLDAMGTSQGLWIYRIIVFPLSPFLAPVDWGVLPVSYMMGYQYFPKWKGFIIAQIIISALYSFIGEGYLSKIGVYLPLQWEHIYSFPIYIGLAIIAKATTRILYCLEK